MGRSRGDTNTKGVLHKRASARVIMDYYVQIVKIFLPTLLQKTHNKLVLAPSIMEVRYDLPHCSRRCYLQNDHPKKR